MHPNPIATLYDNLLTRFENNNTVIKERLSNYPSSILSRDIEFDTEHFNTPQVKFPECRIVLTERHLSLVWCIIYIVIDVAQNKMPKAEVITPTHSRIDASDPEVHSLDSLLKWALSLRTNRTEWTKELPNPSMVNRKVNIANTFFLDTICYMMYHEVAHLVNGHWDIAKPLLDQLLENPRLKLNKEDYQFLKDIELEADNFVYESLISFDENEDLRYHKTIAITLAWISSLFFNEQELIKSSTHPDLHIRLFNARQKFIFSEGYEFWLDNVMNVGVSIFFSLYDILYIRENFSSYDEIMNNFFDIIENEANRRAITDDQ